MVLKFARPGWLQPGTGWFGSRYRLFIPDDAGQMFDHNRLPGGKPEAAPRVTTLEHPRTAPRQRLLEQKQEQAE